MAASSSQSPNLGPAPFVLTDSSSSESIGSSESTFDGREWEDLRKTAKEIKFFFRSLNPNSVGTGLMWYDRDNFVLLPLSNWFNNHFWQKLVNLGNKSAEFGAIQQAFTTLLAKITTISAAIGKFDPRTGEETEAAKKLLKELIRIEKAIDGDATGGMRKLSENYAQLAEPDHGASIVAFGRTAYDLIAAAKTQLNEKLHHHIPELDITVRLETYAFKAKSLLDMRNAYREALHKIVADAKKGLSLPTELIEHCMSDGTHVSTLSREEVQVASKFVAIPSLALSIPTQGGLTSWHPMRLVGAIGKVAHELGIWGTCEQTNDDDNLANIFYRINPDTGQILIGCGAIDAASKAEHLATVMKEALKKTPSGNGRWVLHQLNSFTQEAHLIQKAHSHVYLNQSSFQTFLQRPDIKFLHFNTCFNAATKLYSEDPQSLWSVNLDNLGRLIPFILEDVTALLKGKAVLAQFIGEIPNSFQKQCSVIEKLCNEIYQLKKKLQDQESGKGIDAHVYKDQQTKEIIEDELQGDEKEAEKSVSEVLPAKMDVEESEELLGKSCPELPSENKAGAIEGMQSLDDFDDWHEVVAPVLTQKEQLDFLNHKQEKLEQLLKKFRKELGFYNTLLEEKRKSDSSADLNKVHLIIQLFDHILAMQLKLSDAPSVSRTTEVELFLLLYRLLEINPVLICHRGLDRSGAVRALAETEAQIERELYNAALAQKSDKGVKQQQEARVEACRQLFQIIMTLDANRDELSSLTNIILKSNPLLLETDLQNISTSSERKSTLDLRDALFAAIDAKYPLSSGNKGEVLKQTQHYLELVAAQLLSSEAEKVLFSTGVVGFRYHNDAYFPKNLFANPHPPDRWPMFCFVGDKTIKLIEYTEGSWMASSSRKITKAAMQLFLRSSKLRSD